MTMNIHAFSGAAMLGLAVACGACTAQIPASADADADAHAVQVRRIGEMSVARATHQATRLPSGKVLITGGCTGSCETSLDQVELFDPATSTFSLLPAMGLARNSHAAVALTDGRVLVAGGWSGSQVSASVEIFDPASGTFSALSDMTQPRAVPAAVRLADSRVMITGGQTAQLAPIATAELFDPVSQQFAQTGSMLAARVGHSAVVLADGRVLVAGGLRVRRGEVLRSAEIYDPDTGVFEPTGEMAAARHKHAAVRLADGRVLIIGGAGNDRRDERYRSTEIYDPASGGFSPGADMQWRRYKLPDAALLLPSGEVLVAGGAERVERYDPAERRFMALIGALSGAQEFTTATLLDDGTVLLAGGYDEEIRSSASAWRVRLSD